MGGLRLTRRRTIVAVVALTVALGSAAAYALALPEPLQAPVDKVARSADNVVGHIIGPPDTDDPTPSEPDVTVPGSDELPLPGILGTEPAAARKAKAAQQPAPAPAPLSDPVAELLAPPAPAPDPAPAPAPVPPEQPEEKGKGTGGLFDEPLISVPNKTYGENWNFCNNNNSETIVNRGSDGTENDIEQEQPSGEPTGDC